MAPGSIFHHINLLSTSYFFCCFYFALFTLHIYHKNTKNIILSSLSDLTFASGREGIDNPFIALVARFLFVCVGTRDLRVVSYWIDTLVLKNWGKYLRYCAASPFPHRGKTMQAQEVAGGKEGFHTTPMVQYWSVPEEDEGWMINHPQALA